MGFTTTTRTTTAGYFDIDALEEIDLLTFTLVHDPILSTNKVSGNPGAVQNSLDYDCCIRSHSKFSKNLTSRLR